VTKEQRDELIAAGEEIKRVLDEFESHCGPDNGPPPGVLTQLRRRLAKAHERHQRALDAL
jgi:hypothetical protein